LNDTRLAETTVVLRGLLVLVLMIVAGVNAAELQMNGLTRRHETVQAFNVRQQDQGYYAFYLFGSSYLVQSDYPLAVLSNTDTEIVVTAGTRQWEIPIRLCIDAAPEFALLDLWSRQFSEEAVRTKVQLHAYVQAASQTLFELIRKQR